MKKVLITGMIGTGKSTFCKMINKECGIPVFDSDTYAKSLYSLQEVRDEMVDALGKTIKNEDGSLNFKKISEIIFSDKDKLGEVEEIIHPRVFQLFEDFCEELEDTEEVVIFESALIVNPGYNFDEIIKLEADTEIKISRIIDRDKCSRETALNKIANQLDMYKDEGEITDCRVVYNNLDLIELKKYVPFIVINLMN